MRWLFPGREICVDAHCLDCAEPIRLRMRDAELLEVDPPGVVVHANVPLPGWAEHSWAFN